ncbi:MAG: PUA domain-containing protein [Fervidicoccaceae archaeon]
MSFQEAPGKQEIAQIYGVLYYQFGRRAAEEVLKLAGELKVKRYSSGIIREVLLSGKPILYHNPTTGLFTLSWVGAQVIFPLVPPERRRIFVKKDIFERYTKRVLLAPAVAGSSEDIRPGDEVFLVDESGSLLALGKALVSAAELKSIRKGKIAFVRRSFDELQES